MAVSFRTQGFDEVAAFMRELSKDVKPSSARVTVLLNRVGRALRDDARNRITTQNNGKWPKLSKWTRAKTGRLKALITERGKIKFKRWGRSGVAVGHESGGDWSLDDHVKGFTRPAVNKRVVIPLKAPRYLGIKDKDYIVLPKGSPPTRTPSRNPYGTKRDMRAVFVPIVRVWMQEEVGGRRIGAGINKRLRGSIKQGLSLAQSGGALKGRI